MSDRNSLQHNLSIDYDQTWLSFDPTDNNGDQIPDAVFLNLPEGFSASVGFEQSDADGKIDFFIADVFAPLASLPNSTIASIQLNIGNLSSPVDSPVTFSQDPQVSFGSISGESVPGTTDNGSVLIEVPLPTHTPESPVPKPQYLPLI